MWHLFPSVFTAFNFFERRKNEECKEVKIDVKSTYNLAKLLGCDMIKFF